MVTLSVSRRLRLPAATSLTLTLLAAGLAASALPAADASTGLHTTDGAVSSGAPRSAAGQSSLQSDGFVIALPDGDGASCEGADNGFADVDDLPLTGQSVSTSFSERPTLTGGPGDVTRFDLRASATASVTAPGGSFRAFSFVASVRARGDYPADSDCYFIADPGSSTVVDVSLPTSGFLTVEVNTRGEAQGSVSFQEQALDGFSVFQNTTGRTTSTAFLEAGAYTLRMRMGTTLRRSIATPDLPPLESADGRVRSTGTFVRAGGATTTTRGNGRRFVSLPGGRACGANAITASITDKSKRARSIRKVVFQVNGRRAGAVKSPAKGRTVTLRKPARTATASVTATIKRKKGGARTVTRDYAPCSV